MKNGTSLSKNIISIKNTLTYLYNSFYEDNFYNILIKSKSAFINSINSYLNDIIKSIYPEEYSSLDDIISKIKSDINIRYNNDYEILYKSYINIKNKKEENKFLINYIKHCSKCNNYALHECIKNKLNKLYEIKINEDIKYILCTECKICFLPHCIKLVCDFCNKEYFSRTLNKAEEKNIFLANWTKYHCNIKQNHIMKCINCKNNLYLDLLNNLLICKNINCNFKSKPLSILWKCSKCGEDFRSNAKVYNLTEIEIIKKSIKIALICKKKAFPKKLPCCNKNPKDMNFYHNDKCKGILYRGYLLDKKIIVCNECKAMNLEDKFIWKCPLCNKKFHLHQFIINSIKSRKYVLNKENNIINNKKNKRRSIDLKSVNNYILNSDKINNNININNYFGKINYYYNTEEVIKKIESISIDKSDKSLSEDKYKKRKKKYKTLDDILKKRKTTSEKNKSTNNNYISISDFSFNDLNNNTINYSEKLNNKNKNKIKKIKNFFQSADPDIIYHKKISFYKKNKDDNSKIKINNSISQILFAKNKPVIKKLKSISKDFKKESNINIINKKNNIIKQNKNCCDINYNSHQIIYKNKIINQKMNIIYNKNNIKNINSIPDLSINKINNNNNKIIYKKKHNRRKSLNLEINNNNMNKIRLNYRLNSALITPQIVNKISKECIIPNFLCEYKYIKLINQGSNSSIYLVENPFNKRKYALKKILCKNLEDVIKYKNQFELLYKLNHPNIIKIYNINFKYIDIDTYYISILMEKAISDLYKQIKNKIILKQMYTEYEIINLLSQIINALIYMKQKKIAHRDIKPQNILVFPNNIYKITNLGEAKQVQNINNIITLKGTELYMSPIVHFNYKLNKKNLVHDVFKSDAFSLGYSVLFMICLNIKVLEDIREINNMEDIIKIVNYYFNRKLYSNILLKLIIGMIHLDENKRYSFERIYNELKKFEF